MNVITKLCLLLASALATASVSSTVRADESVTVLMLGDSGIHKPSEFYRHLVEPLSEHSIHLRYTENPSDLNPDKLAKFAANAISAGLTDSSNEALLFRLLLPCCTSNLPGVCF